MSDIAGINGGVTKPIASLTDKFPAQEAGGNSVPIELSGLIAGIIASPAFIEAVQDIVGALVVGGTGVTVTYNDTTNTLTITAP